MAVTISLYNHTAKRFADGANAVGDTYKVMLCTTATFDAADTTLAGITKTEVVNGDGYTTGGVALTNVAVTTVATNGAKFDADDASWTASGGPITASFAILYNDTDSGDPPVAFIDFDGSESAGDGTDFLIVWNASGIFTWSVT
jgi:hypothetical protein